MPIRYIGFDSENDISPNELRACGLLIRPQELDFFFSIQRWGKPKSELESLSSQDKFNCLKQNQEYPFLDLIKITCLDGTKAYFYGIYDKNNSIDPLSASVLNKIFFDQGLPSPCFFRLSKV